MANNIVLKTASIGASIGTAVLNDRMSKSTKGKIGSVRAFKNPQGVLNQAIFKANSKLPEAVRNNQAIRDIETQTVNTVGKGIVNVLTSATSPVIINFLGSGGVLQNVFGNLFNSVSSYSCGFIGDVSRTLPDNQLIKISSTSESASGIITARLQKMVSISVEGTWKSFIDQNSQFDQANMWGQVISGALGHQISLINAASARRMWVGTSPIKMSIELYFMAVSNTFREVVEPCIRLQRMALPELILDNKFGLLSPPGPNPIGFTGAGSGGDNIEIKVGNFLVFSPVIIKSVSVDFDNKLDVDGYPISAKANLEFETFQIMTKQDLTRAVPGMPDTKSSSVSSSINQSKNDVKEIVDSLSIF